ncbi:MAG TPA: bacterial transcriptional activator domain-containing protein [Roseiflexaceae bacterium]|nr:bacterial transcriptional activator domain-containing protein [Roseiflexaceae bacterium]
MMNEQLTQLRVLGPFDLNRQPAGPAAGLREHTVCLNLRRKTRALLAYLAEAQVPVRRESLAALFFPDTDDPLGALRWHLSAIRRHVDPTLLCTDRETVQLDRAKCWVDTEAFERMLDIGVALSTEQITAAIALYRGEYLAGMSLSDAPEFEMWALGRRAHYQQRYEQALVDLVERLIQAARYAEVLPWAQRLIQSNPLAEAAHLQLMRAYALNGQRHAALAHYQQYRRLLKVELQSEPDSMAFALHASGSGGGLRNLRGCSRACRRRAHGFSHNVTRA